MSSYDSLPRGSQVKLWDCEFKTYKVGDEVDGFFYPEYIVLLVEGGYVKVEERKIIKIVENYGRKYYYPEDFKVPCVDKWGDLVKKKEDLEHANIMGGHYYYRKQDK